MRAKARNPDAFTVFLQNDNFNNDFENKYQGVKPK